MSFSTTTANGRLIRTSLLMMGKIGGACPVAQGRTMPFFRELVS